jgi:hypothetical protein
MTLPVPRIQDPTVYIALPRVPILFVWIDRWIRRDRETEREMPQRRRLLWEEVSPQLCHGRNDNIIPGSGFAKNANANVVVTVTLLWINYLYMYIEI